MKTFTRYDAEHHDPATRYVLAEDAEALLDYVKKAQKHAIDMGAKTLAVIDKLAAQVNETLRLQRERDALLADLKLERMAHAATRARLEAAPSYPVENPQNPLLTIESGDIRYVLEAFSDEDGDWFEVKSATPTEAQTLADFTHSARPDRRAHIEAEAHEALRQWCDERRADDEASRAY